MAVQSDVSLDALGCQLSRVNADEDEDDRVAGSLRVYEASNHDIEPTPVALGRSSILSTRRCLRIADSEAEALILKLGPAA